MHVRHGERVNVVDVGGVALSPEHLLRSWPTMVLLRSALGSGLAFRLRVCLCATELGTAVFRGLLNLSAMQPPRP